MEIPKNINNKIVDFVLVDSNNLVGVVVALDHLTLYERNLIEQKFAYTILNCQLQAYH